MNLPDSFRAESRSALCGTQLAEWSDLLDFIRRHGQAYYPLDQLSIGSAAGGRFIQFCVASQYHAPNFLHIFSDFHVCTARAGFL